MSEKKICMIMDGNFVEHDGEFFSPHMNYRAFLSRFSENFEHIEVVARAFSTSKLPTGIQKVCEYNTSFSCLSSTRGALGFVISLKKNIKILKAAIERNNIILIRFPGNLAILAVIICTLMKREYSIELVAEPKDYFSKHSSTSIFRKFFGLIHTRFTKYAVSKSRVVRYVTSEYLQKNYPTRGVAFGFSDVYLPEVIDNNEPVLEYDFLNVAMMHNHSKGHSLLIEAISELFKDGIFIKVCLIGDGAYKKEFEEQVKKLGLSNQVIFLGAITDRTQFYRILASSRFFVLPSFQEGMPRALLESINAGLTAISSDVGGIPEVLCESSMFTSGSLEELKGLLKRCFYDKNFEKTINNQQKINIKSFQNDYIYKQTKDYCNALKKEYS